MMVTGGMGGEGVIRALAAARAGVDWIQVREKQLTGGALCTQVRLIVEGAAGLRAEVWVNGRPDVALAAGAQGVQLPEDGLPVAAVRRRFPMLRIGASRHAVEGVRQAAGDGADAVVFGPVFPTPGKEERACGVDVLAAACQAVAIPVIAIGGIAPANLPAVAAAGAAGVALLRPFQSGDAAELMARLRTAMG